MHTNGDLYISVGDNSNPSLSDGFAPLDDSRTFALDSQKSASNFNRSRGGAEKIPARILYAAVRLRMIRAVSFAAARESFALEADFLRVPGRTSRLFVQGAKPSDAKGLLLSPTEM